MQQEAWLSAAHVTPPLEEEGQLWFSHPAIVASHPEAEAMEQASLLRVALSQKRRQRLVCRAPLSVSTRRAAAALVEEPLESQQFQERLPSSDTL